MCNIKVTILLQMVCPLIIATQVGKNETLPMVLEQAAVGTTDSPVLPSGYIPFPEFGVAYKLFETEKTHDQANKMCSQENGQLAVIDTWDKVRKVFDNFSSDDTVLVGLHLPPGAVEWITIDGKTTKNLPWGRGEPSFDLRCATLLRWKDGLMNRGCDVELPYLCEIALPRN